MAGKSDRDIEIWRAAFAEFEALRQLQGAERDAALERLRHADPSVHEQAEKLLRAHEDARDQRFLTSVPGAVGFTPLPGPQPGDVLGSYRVERSLGAGGMGAVWLAHRADGLFDARVALKLLHPELHQSILRERFIREGRILGQLSHPNIARLLDAGTLPDSRLYLALEYVEGERIDQWCDNCRLSLEARVRLFLQVCEAVAHAHTRLVVHRDLKPSNILVTVHGEAKLLDFGIAKLIEDHETSSEATELTRMGGRVLTPEYASPEQVAGTPITTASDVYSLGVLLFLLLSGRRPYGKPGATASELERAVLETEPMTLTRAADMPIEESAPAAVADRRATSRKGLVQALRGDLDVIVRKALRKSAAERYPTVQAFADDLRRWINHEPVQARPDSLRYRARKYIRRHRVAIASATAIFLALTAGLFGTLWQAHEARRNAQAARAQAQRAERVKDFVVALFKDQSPYQRTTTATHTPQQLLAKASEQLQHELAEEPEVRVELLADIGAMQGDLGDPDGAEITLRRAIAETSARYGADSLEVVDPMLGLAAVLRDFQGFAEAEQLVRRALAILQSHGERDTPRVALSKSILGVILSLGKGAPPEAVALFEDALRINEAQLGHDHPKTQDVLYRLAQLDVQTRADDRAEIRIRDLIERATRQSGEMSARLADALTLLGDVQTHRGQLEEAVTSYARAIAMMNGTGASTYALANAHANQAIALRSMRRFGEARAAYAAALTVLPEDSIMQRAGILRGEGRVALALGQADDGEALLRDAYELLRRSPGSERNGFTWYCAAEWGRGLLAQGKVRQAETVQREALSHLRAILGPDAHQNAMVMDVLATTLEQDAAGRAEAERLRRDALAIVARNNPRTSLAWSPYALSLARNLAMAGDRDAAEEGLDLARQCAANLRGQAGQEQDFAECLVEQAACLSSLGRNTEASATLQEALGVFSTVRNPDAEAVARARGLAARIRPA
ncbi:MAG TPA: protein kinase [Nevskiaceae bacterium]|nr:protein kinase [Nevskiaceae bacterium]